MKKLFLASAGLPKETRKFLMKLLLKEPKETTVGFIPTAADPESDKWFVDKAKEEIMEIGMNLIEVDLKGETKVSLLNKLLKCDVIYVNGGNTFYLLHWVRKSGFDQIIHELLKKSKIYVGSSAGSYIICPTIETAAWRNIDKNIVGIKDLTALNIVPFLIFAHFEEKYLPIIEKASIKADYPVVALSDKQAVIVLDDTFKIVGEGEKRIYGKKQRINLN